MARNWTEQQQKAINTRDKTLLTSAAAGSGKTATLTERIIRSILDEDNPININEMLIVTFTKAATGELKERIGRAIKDAILTSSDPERLEVQLHMLPSASISTIDSFCSSILRGNCERVGVDPGYRIIDPAEAELLTEGLLDAMFSEIYDGNLPEVATPEELERLSDSLTDTRSQGDLSATIRMFYGSTKDLEEGVGTIRALVEEYNPERFTSVEKTRLGGYAFGAVRDFAEHYRKIIAECLADHVAYNGGSLTKRIDVLTGDLAFLDAILAAKSYTAVREIFLARNHPATPNATGAPHLSYTTEVRRRLKEDTQKKTYKTFLEYSEAEWRESYSRLYSLLSVLVRIVEHFDKIYTKEKLRIGALEYSDVTRYTYECLWQDGKRTDVAEAEAARFRAVYVDEYQDVNALQHKIFEAVGGDRNRFMVGDIKQSIYGFRGADPSIFAKMKTELPILGTEGDGPAAAIFMSENFRCDKGIIDYVNEIFDNLFYVLRDSIGFVIEDRLISRKIHPSGEPEYRKPELCLLPYRINKLGIEEDDNDNTEAMLVAEKIRELLATGTLDDGSPIRPGDIAIIMRNAHGKDSEYAAALSSLGIPSALSESEDFFLNADVLLLTSILRSIDNPRRDIYLAAMICSPIFGFSAGELVKITALGEPTLYDGLVRYVRENPDYERGARLILWLKKYRAMAEGCAVDMLINRIFHDTGLLALASGRGGRDELLRFYEHARHFESSSFRGLYNFLNYINGIVGRQNPFDKREASLATDEVKIITAHSSKGLEFPVVFFVGTEQAMKRSRDEKERLVYESRFGISLYLRTPSGLSLVSNPTKSILLDYRLRRRIEEEARVLYVILTRARERLYIVGKARRGYDKYLADIADTHEHLTPYAVYGMTSYTDMITYSSGLGFVIPEEFLPNMSERLRERLYPAPEAEGVEDFLMPECPPEELMIPDTPDFDTGYADFEPEIAKNNESVTDILLSRFRYEYPYEHLTRLPKKLSVSRLYPEILDPSDNDAALIEEGEEERITKMGRLPSFATGSDESESARRGIATHLLFQFCDLEGLHKQGVAAELERLRREKYISDIDAGRVRLAEVEAFVRSPLFADMLAAKNIWRELRFNTRLPADMLTTDEETREKLRGSEILVQGVIDCLYEDEDGNLHLVDYKTDRLTWEERKNPALAEARLYKSHSLQLSYYAEAVERMMGKRPVTVEVYSLHLGRCVSVARERDGANSQL